MSILDAFETGQHKQEKSHLRNLIMIAKADGEIDQKELDLIEKMAARYNVSKQEVQALYEHPEQTPIHPPTNKEDRYKRLYNLVEMAMADAILEHHEKALLLRYAIGIGFAVDKAEQVVDQICALYSKELSFEDIYEKLS